MSTARQAPRASLLGRLAIALLRPLLRRWVAAQVVGAEALRERLDRGTPLCWVLQFRQTTALVLLDEQAAALGLPLPLSPLVAAGAEGSAERGAPPPALREPHAFFYLTRDGQPSPLAARPYRYAPRLERLVHAVRADPAADVQLVPVHVFWGRAPHNQDSVLKALLAEAWVVPGPLRQLLRVLIHGRQTMIEFGEPVSLRQMLAGAEDDGHGVRRAARLLRAEFRRARERVVGPDLSHRHTLIQAVIEAPPVQEAIDAEATARKEPPAKAEARARRAAWEIASNYTYPAIRVFEFGLQWLWTRLYDGVVTHRLDEVRPLAHGATVVYVPCHRSHVDYLLLSYLVYRQGLPPPHIAAGANLNLPVVGPILRRGGAFFLRRSFRGDALYATVFAEYLHAMITRGFPIEYFVEGGRSRTGRMLAPKAGLLAMTVESWLRTPHRPLVFVPVYIGYERLVEGDSYVAELAGRPKEKESLLGLLRSARALREHFGRVYLNVGEPIPLGPFLHARGVQPDAAGEEARRSAIDALARAIVTRINQAVVFNPVNLLAMVTLASPRQAVDAAAAVRQLDWLRALLHAVPYSERTEVDAPDGAQIVADAERNGTLWRIKHPLGDVLQVPARQAPLLAFFRNNVLHAVALPALLAALRVQHPGIERERLGAIAGRVMPFLRADLFLADDPPDLDARVQATLDAFDALGPADVGALPMLAQAMRAPLERYFITLSVLRGQGSGALAAKALEDLCGLLAQRMAYLHEAGSPEFADRAGFRAIVATLDELGWVRTVDGRLTFGDELAQAAEDAPWLLSPEVCRAIERLTALTEDDLARAEGALAAGAGKGRAKAGARPAERA